MPTIESLTERSDPISPDTTVEAVLARFKQAPELKFMALVERNRPVGIVDRLVVQATASKVGRARVAAWVDHDALVLESGIDMQAAQDILLSQDGALPKAFLVAEHGRYLGVAQTADLIRANTACMAEAMKELEAECERANSAARSKSQFLSVISHELRTPMNGVRAVAELLQRQPLGKDAHAYVQTIIDSSDSLLGVLSDALDLSRAEAGELGLTREPTFLREMMDDVQGQWSARAAQDGVSLMISYHGDPDLAAEVDAIRVKQVFNTLIGNALRFARQGVVEASLKATAHADEVRLEVRIRDNGLGMPRDQLEQIFEPFTHGVSRPHGSTGLSLSICRQIVEAMDGRIWAESNPGRGSTLGFDADVRRARIERPGQGNVSELPDMQLMSQPHVLIVDDNATNRVVAQALCEMFGCTSECAEDGMEALDAMRNRRFDLVLMDIKMPRMDGVQATREIRALPGDERETPIIALTANADPDDARHYIAMGMAAVVEKPIKPERLRAAMNAALGAEPVDLMEDRTAVA
jgi:signal transduction histidine kinase/CheY-like chemotaxis protein